MTTLWCQYLHYYTDLRLIFQVFYGSLKMGKF